MFYFLGVSQPLREVDSTISHLMYMISLTSLLAAFLDRFGDTILQNTRQIINFINSILKRYSSQMTPKKSIDESLSMNSLRIDSHEEDDFYQQTLNLALMLLSTLVANEQVLCLDLYISNLHQSLLHYLRGALHYEFPPKY